MNIAITLSLVIISYLIGRYYKAVTKTKYNNLSKARDYWRGEYGALQLKNLRLDWKIADLENQFAPKFQLVANKDKHPAANDNYLYIEGEINGNREAGLITLNAWEVAKERLSNNPEDKPH